MENVKGSKKERAEIKWTNLSMRVRESNIENHKIVENKYIQIFGEEIYLQERTKTRESMTNSYKNYSSSKEKYESKYNKTPAETDLLESSKKMMERLQKTLNEPDYVCMISQMVLKLF